MHIYYIHNTIPFLSVITFQPCCTVKLCNSIKLYGFWYITFEYVEEIFFAQTAQLRRKREKALVKKEK